MKRTDANMGDEGSWDRNESGEHCGKKRKIREQEEERNGGSRYVEKR